MAAHEYRFEFEEIWDIPKTRVKPSMQPTRAELSRHAGREINREVIGALKRYGLVARGRAEFPRAIVTDVYIAAEPTQPLLVGLRQSYEFNKDAGSSLVWLDPYTGDVLLKHDPLNAGPAQTILLFLETAHSGKILGEGGRTIVVLCAASTVVLLLSGVSVWRGRTQKRR